MSYNSSDDERAPIAGPSRPRFTGWLTMAPDVDAVAAPPPVAAHAAAAPAKAASGPASPSLHAPSTHGFAMVPQAMPASKKQRRIASFQIGTPDDSMASSPTGSIDSQKSDRSGQSDDSDDPLFDVRASFAPMPAYGKAKSGPPKLNGGGGMTYGGLEWKGKTVHAVEQEMEQLGDQALLSHAPDATYLASRLEGLKRNLEIEAFQPRWIGDDDAYSRSIEADAASPSRSSGLLPGGLARPIAISSLSDRLERDPAAFRCDDQDMANALEGMPPLSHNPSAPVSNASSVSLVDEPEIDDLPMDYGFEYDAAPERDPAAPLPVEIVSPEVPQLPTLSASLSSAAKAAALDARIEIRALRRTDLEQVRELHVFHGDADRSPDQAENYTTTASFLLRLLVDDRHVCLVAVAKPIPEPADPLPSASALNLARQSNAPYSSSPSSHLGASAAAGGSGIASAALAPRSLSSGASSSLLDSGAGTPVDSLFSAAMHRRGGAPTDVTGATSVTGDHLAEAQDKADGASHDLPGPTESLAPPSVVRVMAAPPPKGSTAHLQTDTIVGVVSAQIATVQAPVEETLWSHDEKMQQALGARSDRATAVPKRAAVEAHLLTLAVNPSERSQGIGAKMLDCLVAECHYRATTLVAKHRHKATSPTLNPSTAATLRTYLEVHPSNHHALDLYRSKGFTRAPGERGTRRNFYRGDTRIPLSERVKSGGTDAWVLERFVD